jgi:hypothetical protein
MRRAGTPRPPTKSPLPRFAQTKMTPRQRLSQQSGHSGPPLVKEVEQPARRWLKEPTPPPISTATERCLETISERGLLEVRRSGSRRSTALQLITDEDDCATGRRAGAPAQHRQPTAREGRAFVESPVRTSAVVHEVSRDASAPPPARAFRVQSRTASQTGPIPTAMSRQGPA